MESTNTAANVADEIMNLMDEISNRHYSVKFYPDEYGAIEKHCGNEPDAHVIAMDQGEHAWSIFTKQDNRRAGTLAALREIAQFHRQSEAFEPCDLEKCCTEQGLIKTARESGAAGQPLVDMLSSPSTRYCGSCVYIDANGKLLTQDQGYAVLFDEIDQEWAVIVRSIDDTDSLTAALNKLFIMTVPV